MEVPNDKERVVQIRIECRLRQNRSRQPARDEEGHKPKHEQQRRIDPQSPRNIIASHVSTSAELGIAIAIVVSPNAVPRTDSSRHEDVVPPYAQPQHPISSVDTTISV